MLEPLYPPTAIAVRDCETNIVIIPGIGTLSPPAWRNDSGNWLERLLQEHNGRVQMWTYQYTINIMDRPIVEQLVSEGQTLLACLDDLCAKGDAKRTPLLLICHSLGGIILKQALALTKDHMFKHLNTIEVISGLVFLATPHLPLHIKSRPNIVENILRLHQRTLLRSHILTSDDNLILAKICHNFELVGVQVPVVSVYEIAESKTYEGSSAVFRRSRQVVIVPKAQGITGARNELAHGLKLDHNEICKVEIGGDLYRMLLEIVESALSDARSLISEMLHASSQDWDFTIRSQTTDDPRAIAMPTVSVATQSNPINARLPLTSAEATFGSSARDYHDFHGLVTNFEFIGRNLRLSYFSVKGHKRNDNFFGRDDVFELMDKNLLRTPGNRINPDQSLRSFALCGMGGLGKTQIAVEYAFSRRNDFDAIFWVTADDKNLLSQEFAQVAVDLGLRLEEDIKDLTAAREHMKGWLARPVRSYDIPSSPENDASWLLIFDNIDSFEVIEEFWPATSLGAIITTSRDPLVKNHMYTANQGIDLQPLSVPDSVRFMTSLTRRYTQPGRTEDEGKVFKVASYLGGLPLLMTQMAGVMSRLRISYSDFLELYHETGLDSINRAGGMETMPEQLFSISSKLGLDGLTPKSLGLLYLISMLDPDRIPEKILTGLCSSSTYDQLPNSLGQYFAARAQLLQTSLIHQNAEMRDIWVHRIVQDVARQKLDDDQTTTIYKAAVRAVSMAWPLARLEDYFKTGRYKDCAMIFPNVLRLKNAYEKMSILSTFRHDLAIAKLFSDAGWYWYEIGLVEESREWFLLVQDICSGLEDKSSKEAAYMIREAHYKLGTASGEMNDSKTFLTQSKIWLQMMLDRRTETGEQVVDYELCIGYNEVGVSHAMNELYDVAIANFLKAVDTFQALPNYDATMLGWTASNIGLVYWVQGNFEEAERSLLDILAIYEAAYGKDDTLSFKTRKMLYALGNIYVSQGRYEEGLDLHTRCLKQYRAKLGDSNHRIGAACHRLADDHMRFRNYTEARKLIDQALKVFRGRLRYRQDLARSLYKAGQLSQAMGNHAKATAEFDEAYKLRQIVVQDDKRNLNELKKADFDNLVVFWSR